MECQICFEIEGSDGSTGTSMITQICGQPECVGSICPTCLTSHVRVALDGCYAGVLPKVRCPFCLVPLNKTQWMTHIDVTNEDTKILTLGRYETFCKKACSFQAPCCHKVDYTHLRCEDMSSITAIDRVVVLATPRVASEEPESAPPSSDETNGGDESNVAEIPKELTALCREFCFHRANSRSVIQSVLETCDKRDAADKTAAGFLVQKLLDQIMDDERRATLLLSYLYLRPLSQTHCCKTNFCFNCKRSGHHEKCDVNEIQVDECLVQCRSCRIMILKVEGCDSVTCVCGFSMAWIRETVNYKLYRKQLVPLDYFDTKRFEEWDKWRQHLRNVSSNLQSRLRDIEVRQFTIRYATLFRKAFLDKIWSYKKRVCVRKLVGCIPKKARDAEMRRWLAQYTPLLRKGFGAYICWFKRVHLYAAFRDELFWKTYYKNHPWELEEQHEFKTAVLKINL
ncbi:hypothetical protein FI667_g5898, partial [Globisporangium splendens]